MDLHTIIMLITYIICLGISVYFAYQAGVYHERYTIKEDVKGSRCGIKEITDDGHFVFVNVDDPTEEVSRVKINTDGQDEDVKVAV